MDHPGVKFGDTFSRFGFIMLPDRQIDRQTESHTHTDAGHRLTVVGVSKALHPYVAKLWDDDFAD